MKAKRKRRVASTEKTGEEKNKEKKRGRKNI